MSSRRSASVNAAVAWHLVTAVVTVAALVIQLALVVRGTNILIASGPPPSTATRVIRFFSYFTVQSNLLVAVTTASLALRPDRDGPVWRVLRLASLFGITVTCLIHVFLLRPLLDLRGLAAFTDLVFHYLTPVLAVSGWLLFRPRPRIDMSTLLRSLVWPPAYFAYTIAHGAATGWYPYPFADVEALGYLAALGNGVGASLLLLGVGALFLFADRRLGPRQLRAGVEAGGR